MLKKNILFIVLILMSVLLVSCTGNQGTSPTPAPTNTPAPTPAPSATPTPSPVPAAPAYEITEDEYAEGDIVIHYPQITGMSDTARQDQINALIRDKATAIAGEGGTIEVDYTVAWTGPRLLSIRYDGYMNVEGAAYPNNLFYTTNVDIADGTKVRLRDVVAIDAGFIETFKAGQFIPWDTGLADAEEPIRENVAGYDLVQALTNADNGYGLQNPDYCFSYFTEDSLGISIGVPHVIGDHAEFEIPYQDIQGNIKDSAIREDFSSVF